MRSFYTFESNHIFARNYIRQKSLGIGVTWRARSNEKKICLWSKSRERDLQKINWVNILFRDEWWVNGDFVVCGNMRQKITGRTVFQNDVTKYSPFHNTEILINFSFMMRIILFPLKASCMLFCLPLELEQTLSYIRASETDDPMEEKSQAEKPARCTHLAASNHWQVVPKQ